MRQLRRAAHGQHDRIVSDGAFVAPKLLAFKFDAEPNMIRACLLDRHLADRFGGWAVADPCRRVMRAVEVNVDGGAAARAHRRCYGKGHRRTTWDGDAA